MSAAFADKLATRSSRPMSRRCRMPIPFPMVLGGQEFTESLQQQVEAVQFGKPSAADAAAAAQADAIAILAKAAK